MLDELKYNTGCKQTCPLFGKEWPSRRRKPLCRLMLEHDANQNLLIAHDPKGNPVTGSVIREICEDRIEKGETLECVALDRK